MKNFMWIFKHYFKRNFLHLANYLLIGLPLIFILAFSAMTNFLGGIEGVDEAFIATIGGLTVAIVLGFQFFGADLVSGWLHDDLKGPTEARLRVSGIDERVVYLAVIVSGWLFSILTGGILIIITELVPFINASWGNYIFAVIAIALVALVIQLVGVLIFYFTKDGKTAGKVGYVFGEIMIGVALFPAMFNFPTVVERIFGFFPAELAMQAIDSNSFVNALPYFGILLAMIVVMGLVVIFVGRGKNNDRF